MIVSVVIGGMAVTLDYGSPDEEICVSELARSIVGAWPAPVLDALFAALIARDDGVSLARVHGATLQDLGRWLLEHRPGVYRDEARMEIANAVAACESPGDCVFHGGLEGREFSKEMLRLVALIAFKLGVPNTPPAVVLS